MINIVEFLVKTNKKENTNKEYDLITLEDLYKADDRYVLFAYLWEHRKVVEGYIIATGENEVKSITKLDNFRVTKDTWSDEIYNAAKLILDKKVPGNGIDFNSGKKMWILQSSYLRDNVIGHDDQKYYDIR